MSASVWLWGFGVVSVFGFGGFAPFLIDTLPTIAQADLCTSCVNGGSTRAKKDQQKATKRNLDIAVPGASNGPHLRQCIPSVLRAQPFSTNAWAWLGHQRIQR